MIPYSLLRPAILPLTLLALLASGCASLPFLSPPEEPGYDPTAARDRYRAMLEQQAGLSNRPPVG